MAIATPIISFLCIRIPISSFQGRRDKATSMTPEKTGRRIVSFSVRKRPQTGTQNQCVRTSDGNAPCIEDLHPPAVARNEEVPRLLERRATDPEDHGIKAHENVDRHDGEPDKCFVPAGRQPQHRERPARLAPDSARDVHGGKDVAEHEVDRPARSGDLVGVQAEAVPDGDDAERAHDGKGQRRNHEEKVVPPEPLAPRQLAVEAQADEDDA